MIQDLVESVHKPEQQMPCCQRRCSGPLQKAGAPCLSLCTNQSRYACAGNALRCRRGLPGDRFDRCGHRAGARNGSAGGDSNVDTESIICHSRATLQLYTLGLQQAAAFVSSALGHVLALSWRAQQYWKRESPCSIKLQDTLVQMPMASACMSLAPANCTAWRGPHGTHQRCTSQPQSQAACRCSTGSSGADQQIGAVEALRAVAKQADL